MRQASWPQSPFLASSNFLRKAAKQVAVPMPSRALIQVVLMLVLRRTSQARAIFSGPFIRNPASSASGQGVGPIN